MAEAGSVWLGVTDGAVKSDQLSPLQSKLGGLPDFFTNCYLTSPPTCAVCHAHLCLYSQLYCPLENSAHHRTLHCFCCPNQECWNKHQSWLVLRSQQFDPSYTSAPSSTSYSNSVGPVQSATSSGTETPLEGVWCEGEDDWDMDNLEVLTEPRPLNTAKPEPRPPATPTVPPPSEDVLSQMSSLVISSCHGYSKGISFPSFYLSFLSEFDECKVETFSKNIQTALAEFHSHSASQQGGVVTGEGGVVTGEEEYEKGVVKHGDVVFHKFYKKVSKYSQQLLRYDLGGEPLLITAQPDLLSRVPACEYCHAPRTFEFQFMPGLIYFLQQSLNAIQSCQSTVGLPLSSPEYGTVLVFTCGKSCWNDSKTDSTFKTEWVFVQPDVDQNKMILT